RVSFTDPISPEETKAHPGGPVAYLVRTRASQKRASADSNVVSVRVYPVPAPVAPVEARVTETGVELTWTAPDGTAAGEPINTITGYRIYRAENSIPGDGIDRLSSGSPIRCQIGRAHV